MGMLPNMTLNRTLKWLGILFAAFILYALSFGLALRFTGAIPGKGWPSPNPVIRFIRFVCAPLGVVGGYLRLAYEHYLGWGLRDAELETETFELPE
jgi:hypothetical protein